MEQQKALAEIVGPEHVSDEPGVIEAFSKDHSFARACEPCCVVRPGDAGQVEAIVKWANEARSPLIPVSSGPPHFRGDTVPVLGGVAVDLSRINAIRMIDRPERVAMIEPGVRFGELQTALEKEGLRLPAPLSPRSSKPAASRGSRTSSPSITSITPSPCSAWRWCSGRATCFERAMPRARAASKSSGRPGGARSSTWA